jgi:hypothetical protein
MTLRWTRVADPAVLYQAAEHEIVWDPTGWHLWRAAELLGVFTTLSAAKRAAEEL